MGAPDWHSTLQRPATAVGGVPKRDIAVGPEGTTITLGDTTVTIVATPGHSPGTLSYVFPAASGEWVPLAAHRLVSKDRRVQATGDHIDGADVVPRVIVLH
jgi:hypothetical protein